MPTRRERERAQHRRLALESAEAVFAEKGFHAATVQEIADRAEFSVGYLYNLFESKEAVFAELVHVRTAQYVDDVEQRLRGEQDVVSMLKMAIRAKLEFFQGHGRYFSVLRQIVGTRDASIPVVLPKKTVELYDRLLQRLSAVMVRGMEQGVFIKADPLRVVLCLEGMTEAALTYWLFSGGTDPAPIDPELVAKVLFDGILVKRSAS